MTTFKLAVSKYPLKAKIPPGDPFWSKFNASFINREIETQHILQAVYDGYPFATQHTNAWRDSKNYLAGQVIGLDFDTGDKSSTLPELIKDKFISRYAAFAHTTMSHTDEAPRARVVFVLDTPIMQAKNYALAAASILWMFGTADRACKDAARFWYGSPGCQFEYINSVLPLDVVKKMIGQYRETGNREKHKATKSDYRAPASQQEVADALTYIKPWSISYDEWLQVLMGIHAEFGDAGLSLAANWAQGYDGEVKRKFQSFKQAGNTSGAVSIATVYKFAIDAGWKKGL